MCRCKPFLHCALAVAYLAATMGDRDTRADELWAPHIQRAFMPWMSSGISETAVTQAAAAHCWQDWGQYFDLFRCLHHWFPSALVQQVPGKSLSYLTDHLECRFKILSGHLYINLQKPLASEQDDGDSRAMFAVAMLLEVLHAFPGQISDTDAVFHTTDWPCNTKLQQSAAALVPILGFSTTDNHLDIAMPDFTVMSHQGGATSDPKTKKPRIGWKQQCQASHSFEPKIRQLFWRGRHTPDESRDHLQNELVDCPKQFEAAGQHDLASMFNVEGGHVSVYDRCQYQYLAYLESRAYSASPKHMLACGSVVLSPPLEYYHYYAHALAAEEHMIEIPRINGSLCLGIAQVIQELEANPDRVAKIAANALQVYLHWSYFVLQDQLHSHQLHSSPV